MTDVPTTDAPLAVPLTCRCGKSARFIPLYRFSGNAPVIQLQHPPTVQCAECRQWYQWDGDGWVRTSQLDDLELVVPNL